METIEDDQEVEEKRIATGTEATVVAWGARRS
jgi:hypothetical protein